MVFPPSATSDYPLIPNFCIEECNKNIRWKATYFIIGKYFQTIMSLHGGHMVVNDVALAFIQPGKPIQIWNIIGRRPIIAAGNSNGDLQMLTFAGGSSLPALRLLVVHDDEEREFDYIAGAEKILSAAQANSWTSISIKNDWRKVFPV